MDLIVWTRHLPAVIEMLERVPNLRAVVDHIGKPDIKNHETEPWRTLIARVAEFPNVWCKLSGIPTQADHARWKQADVQPYIDHALKCFGLERMMFGSDWPVCLLAASYERVISSTRDALGTLSPTNEQALYGTNAANFYKINTR
jgi:L-fuconolactonase